MEGHASYDTFARQRKETLEVILKHSLQMLQRRYRQEVIKFATHEGAGVLGHIDVDMTVAEPSDESKCPALLVENPPTT